MHKMRAFQALSSPFCRRGVLFSTHSKVFGLSSQEKSTRSKTGASSSTNEKGEEVKTPRISRPKTWKLAGVSSKIPRGWKERKRLMPDWLVQKYAVAEKINGQVWKPQKRLSPDTVEGIRIFKHDHPDVTNDILADRFRVSAEAIRRIVKSKWEPTQEEKDRMRERWARRTERRVQSLKNEDRIESTAERIINRAERYETRDGRRPSQENPKLQDEKVLTKLIAQEEAYRKMKRTKEKKRAAHDPKMEEARHESHSEKHSEESKLRRQLQKLGSMEDDLRRKTDGQQHQAFASLWSQKF